MTLVLGGPGCSVAQGGRRAPVLICEEEALVGPAAQVVPRVPGAAYEASLDARLGVVPRQVSALPVTAPDHAAAAESPLSAHLTVAVGSRLAVAVLDTHRQNYVGHR